MDEATRLAVTGMPAGTVIAAEYQHQGRGTRGRTWTAPPGTCLMFSVILRPTVKPDQLSRLPALVAERLVLMLRDHFGLNAQVKAPNDVLVGGKKICGILCTSRVQGDTVEWVICGIGLNTTMRESELPIPVATSLAIEGVGVPRHPELLATVLVSLRPLLEPDLPELEASSPGCAVQN